ncbi:MAG: copper amine oxidase N-terminal domain-containing protein [Defluviitaleaceae bacterium]|nr:copper amine oxidase N-terminal domain-containing protein [Defluviitaleaceae bacterium]
MRFTKKLLAMALTLVLVFAAMPMTAFANDSITVTIDGQVIIFADQEPVIIDGRTLVPVGGVFGALGFTPTWDSATRTATLTRSDYVVVITIDSATFTTNGVTYTLDVPAQIINGRTMLPIRAVLESVGYELDWDSATRTVLISSGGTVSEPTSADEDTPAAPPAPADEDTPIAPPTPVVTLPATLTRYYLEQDIVSISHNDEWVTHSQSNPLVVDSATYYQGVSIAQRPTVGLTERAGASSASAVFDISGQGFTRLSGTFLYVGGRGGNTGNTASITIEDANTGAVLWTIELDDDSLEDAITVDVQIPSDVEQVLIRLDSYSRGRNNIRFALVDVFFEGLR